MRRWIWLVLLLCFVPVMRVAAAGIENRCTIDAGEVIPGNLYTVCDNLVINGTVQGDLIAAAGTITINGSVEGDVDAAAAEIAVNGTVARSIHALSAHLLIGSKAQMTSPQGDIAGVGFSVELDAPSAGNLYFTGYQAVINQPLKGDIRFDGQALSINAPVGGRVDGVIRDTLIQPPDIPAFNLDFIVPGLVISNQGHVHGQLAVTRTDDEPFGQRLSDYLTDVFRDLLSLVVIGLIFIILTPKWLQLTSHQVKTHPIVSGSSGLLMLAATLPAVLIVVPISVLVVLILSSITFGNLTTIATILIGGIIVAVISGSWFIAGYLSRLVVGLMIGQLIGYKLWPATSRFTMQMLSLLVGGLIYTALSNIPVLHLGALLNLIGICFGLGAIGIEIRRFWRGLILQRELNPKATPPSLTTPVISPPIEPPETTEAAPGMDNLPEGFKWFDN